MKTRCDGMSDEELNGSLRRVRMVRAGCPLVDVYVSTSFYSSVIQFAYDMEAVVEAYLEDNPSRALPEDMN